MLLGCLRLLSLLQSCLLLLRYLLFRELEFGRPVRSIRRTGCDKNCDETDNNKTQEDLVSHYSLDYRSNDVLNHYRKPARPFHLLPHLLGY